LLTACRHDAAQETREANRREKEYSDNLIHKHYAEQRHMDSAAASSLKDDGRRREREARVRQAEHDMVERMYRARAPPLCRLLSALLPGALHAGAAALKGGIVCVRGLCS
jgi:hypothetical protein